jgi:serine/threonine-protein kinase
MAIQASSGINPFVAVIEASTDVNGRYKHPKALHPGVKDGYFSLMFRAKDLKTGQEVALKFFDPSHNSNLYRRQSFTREAIILSEFQGRDNILQLIEGEQLFDAELNTLAGVPVKIPLSFFVTELAPGSLKDYIYSAHTNARDNLILSREICKGIQRLHNNGIFHRDLKPDNCLIFPRRVAKICDFGTARARNDTALLPNYNVPVGDQRYCALELFAGLGNEPELYFGADLFSLGAILFELFTKHILTSLVYDSRILQGVVAVFSQSSSNQNRRQSFDAIGFVPGCVEIRIFGIHA